jgi:hypothetical protein
MADEINLQRGLNQTVDVTYLLAGQTVPVDLGAAGVYTASMVIRRMDGDGIQGAVIDTLTTTNSRIVLVDGPAATGPNIQLLWDTDESEALPNETLTVHGGLKITKVATDEVDHHIRLTFALIQEIIA